MSSRTAGRIIGALVLLAFVVYGTGSLLVDSGAADPAGQQHRTALGASLIILNSVMVATIGVVALPILRPHSPTTAYAYLGARVLEAALLAAGAVLALQAIAGREQAYLVAMLGLGLGSLLFCRVLLRVRLVPRLLAGWGLVGYALLAVGMALELLGVGVALALSVPGGLFEVALGVLLIVRGFPERRPDLSRAQQEPATTAA